MSIGWRVLPKAARVKKFPQIDFSSRHCNDNTTTYLPNLLNTLRIRASSGAILLPPIPDSGTHCDGCDRGFIRVASRADNGSRIDDSPTSLTDTAIRPPSLSHLSSMAVRFRYCPPSAVDSSLLQHYASVDDRNRIICSQCRRTLVPVPRAAASSGKRHPTLQGVPPENQSIEHIPSADTKVIMSSKNITVVDLFDQAALRDPSGIAATFDGKSVSYGQLRNVSIRKAVRLRAQGCNLVIKSRCLGP